MPGVPNRQGCWAMTDKELGGAPRDYLEETIEAAKSAGNQVFLAFGPDVGVEVEGSVLELSNDSEWVVLDNSYGVRTAVRLSSIYQISVRPLKEIPATREPSNFHTER